MNFKLPSTIQELKLSINNSNNIKLFIKREDLIHNDENYIHKFLKRFK